MTYRLVAALFAFTILLSAPGEGNAQQAMPQAGTPELGQMLAPIALYPDPLLAEILAASAYPSQIVDANSWRQNPAVASLASDPLALQTALSQEPWDANVKSLTQFPQVLQMLASNLQWTQGIGVMSRTQQAAVLGTIQQLRQMAMANGSLTSSAQEIVSNPNGIITILPASQQLLYVPYYNPSVYGAWPWPAQPPVSFDTPPGIYPTSSYFAFDNGWYVAEPLFYFTDFDWYHHRFNNGDHYHGNYDQAASVPVRLPATAQARPAPYAPLRYNTAPTATDRSPMVITVNRTPVTMSPASPLRADAGIAPEPEIAREMPAYHPPQPVNMQAANAPRPITTRPANAPSQESHGSGNGNSPGPMAR